MSDESSHRWHDQHSQERSISLARDMGRMEGELAALKNSFDAHRNETREILNSQTEKINTLIGLGERGRGILITVIAITSALSSIATWLIGKKV